MIQYFNLMECYGAPRHTRCVKDEDNGTPDLSNELSKIYPRDNSYLWREMAWQHIFVKSQFYLLSSAPPLSVARFSASGGAFE